MIFLETISSICSKVPKGLFKPATTHIFFVFLGGEGGCPLIIIPVLEHCSKITSPWDGGLVAHVEVFCGLPGVLLGCSNKIFTKGNICFLRIPK